MPETNPTPRPERRDRERRPERKRRRRRSTAKTVWKVVGTVCLTGLITGLLLACFATVYISSVIVPEAREWARNFSGENSMSLTSTMYYTDESGQAQPYLTINSEENRIWVKYEDMPEHLVKALVAIEDKRFYQHKGVDWVRTGKGVLNMFTGGSIQGGSTLTQQLIKNITGDNDVTVKRKILEIFRALELEKSTRSKSKILELYLNKIYLGERCYGVGSAAWAYFGKDVKELSLAQCASLVGITNNPSRYDPYLNKNLEFTNDMANRKRAKLVLWNMFDQKMIDEATYDAACAEVDAMEFVAGSPEGGGPSTVYNWYQDQVIDDVINDLRAEYGWSAETASDKVYYGGLSIYTNVDLRIQGILDGVYSDRNNLNYSSKSGQPLQSAMVILDDQGRVVAISGGIGEKTKNRVWSRASDSKRPSGSSIKPLAVYSPAIEMGLITPNTIIDDVPYQMLGGQPWPVNSTHRYTGLDTVSHALELSHNTTAVRVLGDYVTPQKSYEFLEERYHITSLVPEKWINNKKYTDIGLPQLALGGLTNGVSVYEMAAAYATFPSMGRYVPPRTYSKVVDAQGNVLLDRTMDGEFVIKESTAYYINNMLRGVVTSTANTGRYASFPGMTIAGKTGTTNSKKDLWFAGYTPYYTAVTWVGYDRQETLPSGHPQIDLWNKVMRQVHEGLPDKAFPQPSDRKVVTASYCRDSGKTPSAACALDARGSRVATGVFLNGDQPVATDVCTLHTEVQVCTADPVKNEETGESLSRYHLAGEFCPEENVQTISVLDYTREGVAAMCTPGDSWALKSSYEEAGICQVHNAENTDPMFFDPEDPSTWPTHDPNFNIGDPSTWPKLPDQPTDPHPGGDPSTPVHTLPPQPSAQAPDDHEPYVPVGIPTD